MVRKILPAALMAIALAVLAGCGGSGSSSCIDEGAAVGLLIDIICADPPTQPFYSWDSSVAVSLLEVRRTSNENVVVWSVLAPGGSLVEPVRHGQIPPSPIGAVVNGNETELERGIEYRVTLFDSDQGAVIGQRTFTVLP